MVVSWPWSGAQRLRDRDRVARHPLAVAEGVAVRRFDRLAPVPHDREVGLLQAVGLGGDVHQVHPRVEPGEEPVGGVEQLQRLLVAARGLVEPRQLPGGLRLAQHRPGRDRLLDRRLEPRLREGEPAGLAEDHAEHLVGVRLVEPGAQLVEDRQRLLRVGPRLLEPLPGDVDLGMVQQAESLEMDVAHLRG